VTTMVCFKADGAAYCMPVVATLAVRRTTGMITLPAPRPDVAGIIPGDPPLTVISPLGSGGTHILVVETGEHTFGLQVDMVIGLRRVADSDIRPAPRGQHRALISGTIESAGELVMVANPLALAARL
jgi:chemotaxis signal transduction protein